MKNVKVYRAATLREALEEIKQELGDNALVLGHQRVRAGGLFGLGGRELIEVRAMPNTNTTSNTPKPESKPEASKEQSRPGSILNLLDETPAKPAAPNTTNGNGNGNNNGNPYTNSTAESIAKSALASLAARTYNNTPETTSRSFPPKEHKPQTNLPPATTEPASLRGQSVASELQRLRAEMRELKFSLSVLGRPYLESNAIRNADLGTEADLEIYDSPYYEAYQQLLITGMSGDLARRAIQKAVQMANGNRNQVEIAQRGLATLLHSLLHFSEDPLIAKPELLTSSLGIIFLGPTGVGKTTTIAKLAAQAALRARQRVELITLDTYRIAAVEQLKTYAEIIGAGFQIARSIVELDAMTRRYAGKAIVLIDTAGRSPNDLADQMELVDYLRSNGELTKCLVLQATTHHADAQIASKKFALYNPDQLVITKFDETSRPGAAINIALDSGLPLTYICTGQRVPDDIEKANPGILATQVLRIKSEEATAFSNSASKAATNGINGRNI